MVIFGIIGYFMRKTGFPVAPFLISMILEPYAESNLRRFLILSRGSIMPIFFKPIAVLFILLTFISLYYFLRKKNWRELFYVMLFFIFLK
jgi:putative tricarboxylic transport membrane protein